MCEMSLFAPPPAVAGHEQACPDAGDLIGELELPPVVDPQLLL